MRKPLVPSSCRSIRRLDWRGARSRTVAPMAELTRRQLLRAGASSAGLAVVPFANPLGFDIRSAQKIQQDYRLTGAREVKSLCRYGAVGCGLIAYTKQDSSGKTQLLQIEGDPDSPINEDRICPKGATAMQLATSSRRV